MVLARRTAVGLVAFTAEPLFSVVVPVRDDPLVGEAVASALAQDVSVEVLVVDDGSATAARVPEDPRVRMLRHPEALGPAAARNTGILASTGRFVAFLDSDDLYKPGRLQASLHGHAKADVVVVRRGRRRRPFPIRRVDNPGAFLAATTPCLGMTSARRDLMPLLDPEYRACEDVEWWLRVAQSGLSVAEVAFDGWEWRVGDHPRVLTGPSARLAFSYRLLRDHGAFFAAHRAAAAFRWRRIASMERQAGDLAASLKALRHSFWARPSAGATMELHRLAREAVRRRTGRKGLAN